MTYEQLVAWIETAAVVRVSESPDFALALPPMIADAELRCITDAEMPPGRRTAALSLAAGAVSLLLPADAVVPRSLWLAVELPGGVLQRRSEVLRRDPSFLREYWPDQGVASGLPRYWAVAGPTSILVAPGNSSATPMRLDMDYIARPAGLAPSGPATWLSLRFPALLRAAVMIAVSGWQRNFGMAGSDPQMPASWGREYAGLLATASAEIAASKAWGPFDPGPTPARSQMAPAA